MSNKSWDEMTLTERTTAVNNLKSHFESKGRPLGVEAIVELAEYGYTPNSSSIQKFINYETDLESIKPAPIVSKPVDTGYNLTEATRAYKADSDAKERAYQNAVRAAGEIALPTAKGTSWL
jgi:hypothetical protein